MTTTSPAPFPEYDRRKLSPKETMQRINVVVCALPTCSGQVYVGMFFDGAGNNCDKGYVEPSQEVTQYVKVLS